MHPLGMLPVYFNPRPHAGATLRELARVNGWRFQSTPPCGGDVDPIDALATVGHFNPRPHAGATRRIDRRPGFPMISIHAPMRGRQFLATDIGHYFIFQSTPPCGGDIQQLLTYELQRKFQSTPPCGGDETGPRSFSPCQNFNPRPHAGAT